PPARTRRWWPPTSLAGTGPRSSRAPAGRRAPTRWWRWRSRSRSCCSVGRERSTRWLQPWARASARGPSAPDHSGGEVGDPLGTMAAMQQRGTRTRRPRVRSRAQGMGVVDYTLAKRALLREFRTGLLSRLEICDAHPELLRAAKYMGLEA